MTRMNLKNLAGSGKRIFIGVGIGVILVAVGVVSINAFGSPASDTSPDATAQSDFSAANDFSALTDGSLPSAPESVINKFRDIHTGAATDGALTIGSGMYITNYGDAICGAFHPGSAGCTDQLDNGIWLFGDMIRQYDSPSAPFKVVIYGLAKDGVTSIDVSVGDGRTVSIPVNHNGFRETFNSTSFGEILGIRVNYSSSESRSIDPSRYFPTLPTSRLRKR